MAKTNFEKVIEFNRAFDMVKTPKHYLSGTIDEFGRTEFNSLIHYRPNLFKNEPKTIKLRLDLIKEEIGELNEAVKNNDLIEIRDAIGDILYVVYGMCDVLGISINSYFKNLLNSQYIFGSTELNLIKLYSNTDETNGKPLGITNFNWVKIYIDKIIKNLDGKDNLKLINDSYNTLEYTCNNLKEDDINNIPNMLSYLLMYVYLYAHLNKIDADSDFTIIHNSNMSKLCDTEEDAKLTVEDYEEKFKNGKSPYDSPYYYYLDDLKKWIIKNKSTGKALKNIKYKKVVFE